MPQSNFRAARLALAALAFACLPAAAQNVPARPSGMTDAQIQAQIQSRGLGDMLRQRVQQSGLTPDQVRARLRSAGYSENILDAYLEPGTPGQAAPAPSLEVLRSAASLGLADFRLSDTTLAGRDSILLTRSDSFLLDTLGLVMGRDSIPTMRDSLGVLRLDTAGVRVLAARIRRPRIFGLEVFRRSTTQFTTVSTGPVDADYRLGPGDELVLILTGDVEQIHPLAVTREGFIVIPQVGQVSVTNLTLNELRTLLIQRLGRVYSSVRPGAGAQTRVDLTVTRVRSNQVFVAGEVVRPGAYAMSALGTVMNALYQAGGPTERGSFRQVRVMRGGRLVNTFDVYDYLLSGNTRNDVRLENGDVVFVPPRGPMVTFIGRVQRPGTYELTAAQDLRAALTDLAGGLQPEAFTGRASIERVLPPEQRQADGRDRTVIDVDLQRALTPGQPAVALVPNDLVEVFAVVTPVRGRITVRGNVWRPGAFALTPGLTLSQLLATAGGVRPSTYMDRAHIQRLMPDSTVRLLPVDLSRLGAGGVDPELMEYDEVTVFSRTDFRPARQISVHGSVQRPGTIVFRDSMTLRDAIILAGGLRDEAYLVEAEISRLPASPGSDTLATLIRVPLDSSYLIDTSGYISRPTSRGAATVTLFPFDNVFIRRVPGWTLQRNAVITGEVRFPGRYTIQRASETVGDLIRRAGGLAEGAYVQGAQFFRAESRTGRVGIDVARLMRESSYRDNLILLPGDSLHIPQYQPVVRVEGAVNSPVGVAFVPGRNAEYYVERAGGYARRADRKRTYAVQANGAVTRRGERVGPGARVVVPEVPLDDRRTDWAQVVQAAASVLTSVVAIIAIYRR